MFEGYGGEDWGLLEGRGRVVRETASGNALFEDIRWL